MPALIASLRRLKRKLIDGLTVFLGETVAQKLPQIIHVGGGSVVFLAVVTARLAIGVFDE
jgi:hypothetical protein